MKTILITGASSGIGLATATRLNQLGYTVYGTSRKPSQQPYPFTMLELDINNANSLRDCLEQIKQPIDILINNAGYDLYSAAEETTETELRAQLETNFFGAVRVTQAVLPQMRTRGAGKIIQISSVGGLFALPFNSAYAASKFALEGYSESLRYELLPFGIYVSLIEPGQVNTESLATSIITGRQPLAIYQNAAQTTANKLRSEAEKTGLSVDSVVKSITQVVQVTKPKLRYAVGNIAKYLPLLRYFLPSSFEQMMLQRFQPIKTITHTAQNHNITKP